MKLPLYEYECPKDGTFERIQKFSDPPLFACPTCGGPIEKLASAPAIQFKGTGWYVTDYARKGSGDGGKEGKESKDSKDKESKDKESKDKGAAKESSKDGGSAASSDVKSSSSESKPASSGTDKKT